MNEGNNAPIQVTGEERKHPSVRQLARACIQLARLRLEQQAEAEHAAMAAEPLPTDLVEPQSGSTGEEATRG